MRTVVRRAPGSCAGREGAGSGPDPGEPDPLPAVKAPWRPVGVGAGASAGWSRPACSLLAGLLLLARVAGEDLLRLPAELPGGGERIRPAEDHLFGEADVHVADLRLHG